MVNYQARLGRTFAALADPTRRAMLARLERADTATVSELASPFAIKLPAVMKHLDVLSDAGLVARTKSGRTVSVELVAAPVAGGRWQPPVELAGHDPLACTIDGLDTAQHTRTHCHAPEYR